MEEATITAWRKRTGESFVEGEPLYELETDKVTTEVQAPCDGTLLEILAGEGATVEVGAGVCRIERNG
jgi:pyruvate/2-oxoglutarate dehydrogenase complex dihydrolipoamide acyltransferase (E2) component